MRRRASRLVLACLLLVLTAGAGLAALQAVSRRDADRLQQKIDLIAERGLIPRPVPLRTTVTEAEINAYLAVYGKTQLPAGVVEPRLAILGSDRVSGRATVDLDEVRRSGSGGWFDPASYLTGQVPVSAQGVLRTSNGVARFQLESAQLAGITIPRTILQQIIAHYSRTPDYPHGVNLDDPFPLPAGIRQIDMRRGQATVVQQ
jgi:hypothetical protein